MKSQVAQGFINGIDSTINDIRKFGSISKEEESYMAKFLIVFICGLYEEIIETVINEMVAKAKNMEISSFVANAIDRSFRNPSAGNVGNILAMFSEDWKKEIEKLPQKSLEALTSIANNKNYIAHGGPSIVTLKEVVDYYNDSKIVIEKIDDLLL